MKLIIVILGISAGILITYFLNKLFVNKIESKNQRLIFKTIGYFVFALLGLLFSMLCYLKPALSYFIDGRINTLEVTLNKHFPETKIMEININTDEFKNMSDQMQQTLGNIDTNDDGFFEKLVYDAFIAKITPTLDAINTGTNTLAMGDGTLKTFLLKIKELALNVISPYFIIFNILIFFVFIIFVGIYIGIAKYFVKGGGTYNKSLIFGNYGHDEFNKTI